MSKPWWILPCLNTICTSIYSIIINSILDHLVEFLHSNARNSWESVRMMIHCRRIRLMDEFVINCRQFLASNDKYCWILPYPTVFGSQFRENPSIWLIVSVTFWNVRNSRESVRMMIHCRRIRLMDEFGINCWQFLASNGTNVDGFYLIRIL